MSQATIVKTKYDLFREAQAATKQAYDALAQKEGRIRIGPSQNGGLYIETEASDGKKVQITNIERDEAQFIVMALVDIYGLNE